MIFPSLILNETQKKSNTCLSNVSLLLAGTVCIIPGTKKKNKIFSFSNFLTKSLKNEKFPILFVKKYSTLYSPDVLS
jgi:hypothetical protein